MQTVRQFMALCCLGTVGLLGSLWLLEFRSAGAGLTSSSDEGETRRSAVPQTAPSSGVGAGAVTVVPAPGRAGPALPAAAAANTTTAGKAHHRRSSRAPQQPSQQPSPRSSNSSSDQVPLPCTEVCSESAGGLCVPLDLAVFVYPADRAAANMTFEEQGKKPAVLRARGPAAADDPPVVRCELAEHFPGLELIPRQGSCAVVGNGGILADSGCGGRIDAHDFVFRANLGLIRGYEADVGRRVSLSCFNRALLVKYGDRKGRAVPPAVRPPLLDYVGSLGESILWYPKEVFHKGQVTSSHRYRSIIGTIREAGFTGMRFAFSSRAIRVNRKFGISRTATLGLDMYAVAQTFCNNITLFGFYPFHEDPQGRPIKYHYFDDLRYNFTNRKGHDFPLEYTKLMTLEKEGALTLVVGDCQHRHQNVTRIT